MSLRCGKHAELHDVDGLLSYLGSDSECPSELGEILRSMNWSGLSR